MLHSFLRPSKNIWMQKTNIEKMYIHNLHKKTLNRKVEHDDLNGKRAQNSALILGEADQRPILRIIFS